jgi:heme-degrading monooxygenase HmoA
MIAVSNRLQVAKGQEKEFEARFEGRARLVENMPGFVRLEILRPLKSDYYIVLTHWQDEASFHAWHRNRPRAEIFSGPNVFEMHEVIQSAEKEK